MDPLVTHLICLALGTGLGIWIEHRYGPKLSADNAAAHAALTQATATVNQAVTALKGAVNQTPSA